MLQQLELRFYKQPTSKNITQTLKWCLVYLIITQPVNNFQTQCVMFKKGSDQYFLIPYILFMFLHFLFFLPYVLIQLSWYLDIDFFSSIHSKAFEKVFFSYMCCFLRNDLDVYLTLVSLWFLYVISDTIIKYRKKSSWA